MSLVGNPSNRRVENLPLPLREQRLPGLELLHFEGSVANVIFVRQGFLDSGQKRLGVEGLLDKVKGPRLHRQHSRRHVAIRRYHDDRRISGRSDDTPQKFDAAHAGKLVVKQNASWVLQGV